MDQLAEKLVPVRTYDSPVGRLWLTASETGLRYISYFALPDEPAPSAAAKAILDRTVSQLDEYFAGKRHDFDLPLDLAGVSPFRQKVQRYLAEIPYGETRTYLAVAEAVGNRKAVRAVGSACATNHIPIVLPCHRVVPSSGGTGKYAGDGLAHLKPKLLKLEGAL